MAKPDTSLEELHRIKMMQELQTEISDWAKRRLTVFSVFVTILGFFGLSTVVSQTVQSIVNSPVQRQIEKLENAREDANKTTMELRLLSRDVSADGQQAAAAAKDASSKAEAIGTRINELNDLVAKSEQAAKDIIQKYKSVETDLGSVALQVFDESQKGKLTEQMMAARVDSVKEMQQAMLDFVRYVSNNAGDAGMRQRALDLYNEISRIDDRYNRIVTDIQKRNAANIVIYVPKGSALEANAEMLEAQLRNAGYYSSVWHPFGGNKAEYQFDIARDFNNSIDRGAIDNLVVFVPGKSKNISFYQRDIASIARLTSLDLKFVAQDIEPQDKHLRKAGAERFAKDDVILVALLAEK
jgi:hypothetical protein